MKTYNFEEFSFDCETLSLQKDGIDIPIRHQPATLLKHLLEAAPGIVSRQSLQDEIWNDGVNVEFEQSLNACVNQLRTVLGDQARSARFIETLPKRGYRFIGTVTPSEASPKSRRRRPVYFFATFLVSLVLGLTVLMSGASEEDPVSIYVAPVAVDFATTQETEDAIQYALRLEVVEHLTRYDRNNFIVISGESLWEDVDRPVVNRENSHDFVLLLNVRKVEGGFVTDAVLSSSITSGELARSSVQHSGLSANAYSHTATTVANWTAQIINSGSQPIDQPDPVINYNTAYYRNMLNGQRALQFERYESLVESMDWFEKALEIAPASSDALAGKAIALAKIAGNPGFPVKETYDQALLTADAIERDGGIHPRAQLVRGMVYLHRDWDVERAKDALGRASRLAPGDAMILSWKALALAADGDVLAALHTSSESVSMDPIGEASNSDHCWYLNAADRFAEAVQYCDWVLEIDPDNSFNRLSLALALQKSEEYERAIEIMQPLVDRLSEAVDRPIVFSSSETPSARLRHMYCHLGDILTPRLEDGTVANYLMASLWAACGRYDVIPGLLDAATENREVGMLYISVDAYFDGYRASPQAGGSL